MRKIQIATSWVIYQMTIRGRDERMNAVCEQTEWDEMDRVQPGFHTLVQAGFTSEADAEKIARGNSGAAVRGSGKKTFSENSSLGEYKSRL
jgi:hypothetical protein